MRVSRKKRLLFIRQMATLLNAGVPLLKSLQLLEKEETDFFLKKIAQELIASLKDGNSLSEAMKQHSALFPQLSIGMIRAGEEAGMMAMAFQRLMLLEEKAEKIERKIFSITIYPMVILIMTVVIVTLLLTFVIPKFETIFIELFHGKTLPPATQLLLQWSHAITDHALWLLIGGVLLFFLGKVAWHFQQKKIFPMRLLARIPLLGRVLKKKEMAHVLGVLGALLEHGVPILQALQIAGEMTTSSRMHRAMINIAQSLEEGGSISLPMRASFLFPSMVTSMIAIGEETAQLSAILLKIASIYEEEVDEGIERLLSISEPLLLLLLAIFVGSIVIALFLPLASMLGELQ
ncbi:MAG: type II secretion system F family protein [Chthoniobacterales bacterium]|nr:type II secretion system F family protein [Chthoniobacterales bacterium]